MIELFSTISNIVIGLGLYTIFIIYVIYNIIPVNRKYYFNKGYDFGYKNGFLNTKIYYALNRSIPSNQWLMVHSGQLLDTRKKLMKAMRETKVDEQHHKVS